jgi:hypothetical protein
MPKYHIGCRLEYGSEEREKLRLGYAHHVQIEAGTLGVLEVQYFHPLSISNLTLACACCGKTLASYSGVYKHSQKCQGIHPNERAVGSSLKPAHKPITATPFTKDDGAQSNKVSPTGDKPNWTKGGFGDMESLETAPVHKTENTENNSVKAMDSEVWFPHSGFAASNKRGIGDELNAEVGNGEECQVQDTGEKIIIDSMNANRRSIRGTDVVENNAANVVNDVKQAGKKGTDGNLNCIRRDVQDNKVDEPGRLRHITNDATSARETNTNKQNNVSINNTTVTWEPEHQTNKLGTSTKEQCIKKRLRDGKGGKGGKDKMRQTRSQAKK